MSSLAGAALAGIAIISFYFKNNLKNMIRYFQNVESGALISFNDESKKVTEFEEVSVIKSEDYPFKPAALKKVEDIVKRKYARKEKPEVVVKGDRDCSRCGATVPKGKYLTKGMCPRCYNLDLYHRKHGGKKREQREVSINQFECIDCGAEIKSQLEIDKVKYPKSPGHTLVQK